MNITILGSTACINRFRWVCNIYENQAGRARAVGRGNISTRAEEYMLRYILVSRHCANSDDEVF